ncbi:MAG: hypothetical protein BGO63_12485 [Candidatus Accumulibacter sp. 66-26]|nr:TetR/AcrR family transcriptional regulator [Accumulibacter sp.]OJW47404.1 MAG: hypothetical protein BGO63_12485 [Candidatus Accumulibacter sp. 66-26]
MTANEHLQSEQSRAELRKAQVLDAATGCFRIHGFHNTSMAQISKAAGMSVGHIYHYFENKEAIISSIVDRELQYLLTICQRIRDKSGGGDLLRAATDADFVIHETVNYQDASLMLEIIAEAARNPAVAQIVQAADKKATGFFVELFQDGLRLRGLSLQEKDLVGPLEIINAVCEGFNIRLIRNPRMNLVAVVDSLHRTLEFIIEELIVKSPAAFEKK